MEFDKIMAGGNLENIVLRLDCCAALLRVLHASLGESSGLCDALHGACDLLETINRDFQADIDAAEDYKGVIT